MATTKLALLKDTTNHELRCLKCGKLLGTAKVAVIDIQCPRSGCKHLNRFRLFSQEALTDALFAFKLK